MLALIFYQKRGYAIAVDREEIKIEFAEQRCGIWLRGDNILEKRVRQWSEEDESFCDKKRKKWKVKSEFANEKWKMRSESFRENNNKLNK